MRTQLLVFAVLAWLLSWLIWLPLIADGLWPGGDPPDYLHPIGGLGPAAAALITGWLFGGRLALRKLAAGCLKWRVPLRWHALVWLGPAAVFLTAMAVFAAAGEDVAWSQFLHPDDFPGLALGAYWALEIFGFGEETGWRGFLLPRLQQGLSAYRATLVVTAVWVVWHIPLFWVPTGFSDYGPIEVAGWLVSIFFGSVFLTWLLNSTRGSIFIVAIFHGVLDIVIQSPVGVPAGSVLGAVMVFVGIWVLRRYGTREMAPVLRQI
jgi:membrane protease YdiL (CAAX protease family)